MFYLQWFAPHGGVVTSCNFSYDGRLAVTGSDLDNTVRIFDVHNGSVIHEITGKAVCFLQSWFTDLPTRDF